MTREKIQIRKTGSRNGLARFRRVADAMQWKADRDLGAEFRIDDLRHADDPDRAADRPLLVGLRIRDALAPAWWAAQLDRILDEGKVRLAALTHVSNALGTINPIREIADRVHAAGALLLVDGAQGAAHAPVDVHALGADFYAFSAHKLCGPTGMGALWGRREILESMPPYMGGGEMIERVDRDMSTWAGLPHTFEAGTPNIAGAIGMAAALDYLEAVGGEAILAHEQALVGYALERLEGVEGIRLFGPRDPRRRAGVVSFLVGDAHAHDISTILDADGIAIRAGHHCTQLLMRRFQVAATARASFYLYNTREEVDRLVEILEGDVAGARAAAEGAMQVAAAERRYEEAARQRDILTGLESLVREQRVERVEGGDQDVVGVARDGTDGAAVVLRIRKGTLLGRETHELDGLGEETEEALLEAFCTRYYLGRGEVGVAELPAEILLPGDFPDRELLERVLRDKAGRAVQLKVPRRGERVRLLELARTNARHLLEDRVLVRDAEEGAGPVKVGVALTDILTGLYATVGVLAALAHRERSGEGQHIDTALLDVQVACLGNQALNYLTTGVAPKRMGNAHPNIVPYQDFPTADGDIIFTVGNDGQFRKFCEVAGRSEWADDPRFASNRARVAHRAELIPLIRQVTVFRTTAEWVSALEQAGVPCGPINDLAQVFGDPQVQHRGLKVEMPHPLAGHVPQVASPLRLSASPVDYRMPPPLLGEHSEALLQRLLGMSGEQIASLRQAGVS